MLKRSCGPWQVGREAVAVACAGAIRYRPQRDGPGAARTAGSRAGRGTGGARGRVGTASGPCRAPPPRACGAREGPGMSELDLSGLAVGIAAVAVVLWGLSVVAAILRLVWDALSGEG